MFAAREISVVLAACLTVSAGGCASAERSALRAHQRIGPGMTMDQVRDEIGEPVQIVRGDAGQPQMWLYQFEGSAGTCLTVLLVVLIVGLIILVVAAGGSGGGFGGIGGVENDLAEFRVHFNGSGAVTEVSPIVVTRRN